MPFSHFNKKARCAPDYVQLCDFVFVFLRYACPASSICLVIFCFFFVQRFALQFVFHHALRAFIKRVALHFDVFMFLMRLAHKRLAPTASTLAHSATRSRLAPQRRSAAAGGPFSAGPAARCRRGPLAMAQAHRELWSRLGATKMMLTKIAKPAKAQMSSIQAKAFCASVASLPTALNETDAAALSELAFEVGFAEDDLSLVVDSLQAATKSESPSKKERKPRTKMQDFSAVLEYFTEAEWQSMKDDAERPAEVRSIFFGRMMALGAKAPSEGTKRLLTSALLMLTENMKLPIRAQKKTTTLEALNKAWAACVRKAKDPMVYIPTLPTSPKVYFRLYPEMAANAYAHGEGPVASKLDISMVETLASTFKTRGNVPTPSVSESTPTLHLPGGELYQQLQMISSGFQTELQRQSDRQDRMMEAILGREQSSDGKRLRCESGLGFLRRVSSRTLEDEDIERRQFRLREPLALRDAGDPEESSAQDAAEAAVAPPAKPAAPRAELEPSPPPPAASATPGSTAVELLGMIEQRDAQKRLEAKLAKAKKKVEDGRKKTMQIQLSWPSSSYLLPRPRSKRRGRGRRMAKRAGSALISPSQRRGGLRRRGRK